MIELTFYGGVREIGGTKILLRTDGGSVFIDFGKDFTFENAYFEEPFSPPFHIPSLLRVGALPDMPGLYRMDPDRPVDGVIVSHAHLDHCGHVPLLSPHVPVYAGADTRELILIRSEMGTRGWANDFSLTDWRTFTTGDVVEISGTDIRFMPVHVDHSVPAAYAFIIEAGGKKIAYTGDLRMHGRHPRMTEDFLGALKVNPIDALICEGTHVAPEGADPEADLVAHMESVFRQRMGESAPAAINLPCPTEEDVQAQLSQVIRSAAGLVLVEVAPVDLDRVFSVWRAACDAGRILLLPSRLARMVLEAKRRTGIQDLPEIKGSALYLPQARKHADRRSKDEPPDMEELVVGRRTWEQALAVRWVGAGGLIFGLPEGRQAIRENGDGFVICSSQTGKVLAELSYGIGTALHPITFILSKIGPFNPQLAISFSRLLQWLALYGCCEYYQVHVSGHASAEDIERVVGVANPGTLIPVHTRHPEMFTQWHERVLTGIEVGRSVAIG